MAIVASMLWRRLDTPGHDACSLELNDVGWRLQGAAVFHYESGPASITYSVQCDLEWLTLSGQVGGILGDHHVDHIIARQGKSWTLNGTVITGLEHLLDLDLSFTPATNMQQLRRISIGHNESVRLPVAWFNLDAGTLTELPQIYERRSEMAFWYTAPSVSYEGLLELGSNGFIQRYPNLWEAEPGQ